MRSKSDFEPSLIPDSWFRARTLSSPMCELMEREDERRPLRAGERKLGRFVLPPFQRPPVWTETQKVRFIESCWLGLPIGAYVVNAGRYQSPFDLWLIDGQQRVTAVLNYMAGAFPVYGHRYGDLPKVDKRRWEWGMVFPKLETQIEDEAELHEVYSRLAYGGTPHEPR